MLTLYYDGYRARIHDGGSVEYHKGTVVTEAPSQTIMKMVLAVLPFVTSDVMKATERVAQLRREVLIATTVLSHAENTEYRAVMDHNSAKLAKSELLAQLKAA